LIMWFFGAVKHSEVHESRATRTAGFLELEHARVQWLLSIEKGDLPKAALDSGQRTYRSITIDGEEVEFSGGFTDLHTIVYQETLAGRGFGLEHARPSIELVHDLREASAVGINENAHPFLTSAGRKSPA